MSTTTPGTATAAPTQQGTEPERGKRSVLPLIITLLVIVGPASAVVYLAAMAVAKTRRVRIWALAVWTGITALIGIAASGWNPLAWVLGCLAGWGWMLDQTGLFRVITMTPEAMSRILGISNAPFPPIGGAGDAIWKQLLFAAPIGLLLTTLHTAWITSGRAALADLEGPEYTFTRRFGLFDLIRRTINRALIARGYGIDRRRGTVAIGTGRFGQKVNVPVAELQRPTLFFGTNRSGKTAAGSSLLWQAAEGGALIIDFKGDGVIPRDAARMAVANGKGFKHFDLADKSGARYVAPIPGVPDRPAHYDPLRYGNADSKTEMLQNSVPRDGDAAAYLRTAKEFTLVAYQVARITRLDIGRSGFEVLHDLCDLGALTDALQRRDANGRRYFQPDTIPQHRTLAARVEEMNKKISKDELLRSAIQSNRQLLSSYLNGAAAGPLLSPAPSEDLDIDLFSAVLNEEVIVFSLSTQDYEGLAQTIGNLVLGDLNNCIQSLRGLMRQQGMTWKPFYVQIEEFGSASLDVVLNVLNKSGDVGIRNFLSTQSWHDLTAIDGTGSVAKRIVDQAGNIFNFTINDAEGAKLVSDMTPEVVKQYTRSQRKIVGNRAARTGDLTPQPTAERQLRPTDIQQLGSHRWHFNWFASRRRKFELVWVALYDGGRVTHTHPPAANQWWERLRAALCSPEAAAKRFPKQIRPADAPRIRIERAVEPDIIQPTTTPDNTAETPDSNTPEAPTPEHVEMEAPPAPPPVSTTRRQRRAPAKAVLVAQAFGDSEQPPMAEPPPEEPPPPDLHHPEPRREPVPALVANSADRQPTRVAATPTASESPTNASESFSSKHDDIEEKSAANGHDGPDTDDDPFA